MEVQGAQQCRCVLCSVVVESSTTRQKLGSRATKHIIPVIQGLTSRIYHGSEILLVDTSSSYLCQPCFRRLETVSKLRCKLKENEVRIMDDIQKCVSSGFISLTATSESIRSSTLTATPTRSRIPSVHASSHTAATPQRQRVLAGRHANIRSPVVGYVT